MKPLILVGKILVILILPVLFFSYVGENPMKNTEKASRQIAVVNEDAGAEFNKESLNFGDKVSGVLNKDSQYKWESVNRSLAEEGLEKKKYDAVIYMPSDFSKNIFTFNEKDPVKAGVNYEIQSDLNAENMEKVQKELEMAKNKMNTKVSTLYWSYVSQSVDDVRKKFSKILEKEIAFQQSMYNFYTPNSKKLAGEIDQQKKMLEGVFASTKEAGKSTGQTLKNIDDAKTKVASFIEDVNLYQEYQDQQANLFQQTSAENQQLLQTGMSQYNTALNDETQKISDGQKDPKPSFDNNGEDMDQNVTEIEGKISDSTEQLKKISEDLANSSGGQLNDFLNTVMKQYKQKSVNASLDEMEKNLGPLHEKIQNASPGQPGTPGTPDPQVPIPDPPPAPDPANPGDITLTGLRDQIAILKKSLEAVKPEEQPDNWAAINETIKNLEANLEKVEGEVQQQADGQKKLEVNYKELLASLKAQAEEEEGDPIPVPADAQEQAVKNIRTKEKNILESSVLSEDRKNVLAGIFQNEIKSTDMEDLLAYSDMLSAYQAILQKAGNSDDALMKDIAENQEGFKDSPYLAAMNKSLEDVKNNSASIEGVGKDFGSFSKSLDSFIAQYDQNVSDQQTAIQNELGAIIESADQVSANLTQNTKTLETESIPVGSLNGEFMLSVQDTTASEVSTITDLVNSLADRQNQVTDYTNELQTKVGSVQKKADELNNNWALNVGSTKKVKGDVYNILGNTMIDDQQNSYVYDYLANPVKVSGEAQVQKASYAPPMLMLIIILISGLLIGFFLHHYSSLPVLVHIALFLMLNLIVGLVISIYGLKIYPLHDVQALKWTIFTILLLMGASGIIRLAFFIGPFIGSLLAAALIVFFVTPALDLIMPNFSVSHPVSNVYLSIQYGDQSSFLPAILILAAAAIIATAIPYILNRRQEDQELAHEA
ncbi:type VII secretion protein EsaA [Actinomycetes bacterium NPDC127524]